MFGKRILIAVPHPDDEVVACCTAIDRAQEEGASVFALYLTNGCIARETLWPWQRKYYDANVARRRAEAEQAAAFLGIAPIGWSPRPARHLWRELPQVRAEIEAAAAHYGIDQLWVPAYEGGNADHDALNALGLIMARRVSVLEFAEYNFCGGRARSQEFPLTNGTEQVLTLSPLERERKAAALAFYASEQLNLNYVKTARECWRPLAAYDYAKPPHAGKLWYARFQWVPFRHPRVDFTAPQEVSAAILHFFKTQA
jgi:LmbE family N-acetylglucosaminyl deacetylase